MLLLEVGEAATRMLLRRVPLTDFLLGVQWRVRTASGLSKICDAAVALLREPSGWLAEQLREVEEATPGGGGGCVT